MRLFLLCLCAGLLLIASLTGGNAFAQAPEITPSEHKSPSIRVKTLAKTTSHILKLDPHPSKHSPVGKIAANRKESPASRTPIKSIASENSLQKPDLEQHDVYGVVIAVENAGPAPGGSLLRPIQGQETLQKVTVKLDLSGKARGLKNQIIVIDNILGEHPAYNIPLEPGARVLLNMEKNPQNGHWVFYIANRDRTPALMILGTLMVLAMLLIGGPEVAKHALLGVVILIGSYKALFPALLAGTTGFYWIFLICAMFTILGSFIYQVPGTKTFSREQSVVILSTLGGLMILSMILSVMHWITPLSGYSSEGLANLWYQSPRMDYWALYVGSVLIGFQGFLFYLCWMLAQQRQEAKPLSFSERFHVVMLRGRRLLGPMTSSLGLLFLGLFLPILLQMDGTPTAQFMNLESTASMLAFAFSGGLTLILTVPLTALIAAWRLTEK